MTTEKPPAGTPTPDAGSGETDSDSLDVETVGIDEIVRQERVRSIFEARKVCREKRLEAKENGDRSLYRDALEGYIREVESLFQQTEDGKQYWNAYDFGTMVLTPHKSDTREYDEIRSVSKKHEVDFTGLVSLFEVGDPMVRETEIYVPHPGRGRGTTVERIVFARRVPFKTLDAMFSATNSYLSEIGFGVQVDKAQQNTKLDDDLMEEVEQWRRENL
jgi:hypothetical protein